jgi:hypothetical protein
VGDAVRRLVNKYADDGGARTARHLDVDEFDAALGGGPPRYFPQARID